MPEYGSTTIGQEVSLVEFQPSNGTPPPATAPEITDVELAAYLAEDLQAVVAGARRDQKDLQATLRSLKIRPSAWTTWRELLTLEDEIVRMRRRQAHLHSAARRVEAKADELLRRLAPVEDGKV